MPFKSSAQMKACFATNGFNGKIDCDEWAKATSNIKSLPDRVGKKEMGGKMRHRGCLKCGGKKMQDGGPKKCYDLIGNEIPCKGQEMTNASDNGQWMQVDQPNPPMALPKANPLDLVHESDTKNQFKVVASQDTNREKIDPMFALLGAKTGLQWLSGIVDRKRQNQYMYDQFAQLNQMNAQPSDDYQPNPYSLYSKYGGSMKKYRGGGLSRSQDYGSKSKPYPSVSSSDFAGGHRSYPIPTHADAVDALRLASLHGREDVKDKVYAKYPDLKKGYGGEMRKGGKKKKEAPESMPEYKEGGKWLQGAVNPAHKGYCTPMSKSTCTGHRRAFALMMKEKHGFHRGKM